MHPTRFDAWTRTLIVRSSRRRVAALLTFGLLSALLASLIWDPAQAKKCAKKEKKCGTKCIPRKDCCKDSDCGKREVCRKGDCRCKKGFHRCQGACIPKDQCCRNGDCPEEWDCVKQVCRMVQGACPTEPLAKGCFPDGNVVCGHGNPPCHCRPTTSGNRCASEPPGIGDFETACGDCTNDADCVALGFGADSFCANDPLCCPNTPTVGFCVHSCVSCINPEDCPAGCVCGESPADPIGHCAEKDSPCGKVCAVGEDCLRTEVCVSAPGCGDGTPTCRRRCGA